MGSPVEQNLEQNYEGEKIENEKGYDRSVTCVSGGFDGLRR